MLRVGQLVEGSSGIIEPLFWVVMQRILASLSLFTQNLWVLSWLLSMLIGEVGRTFGSNATPILLLQHFTLQLVCLGSFGIGGKIA